MSLKTKLIHVLQSRATQTIQFNFQSSAGGQVVVTPYSFQLVLEAVRSDKLTVESGGIADGWAKYDSANNKFSIGQGHGKSFEALLVHESVHAAFDLRKTQLPWVDNEAAAYIAQGYYLQNKGFGYEKLMPNGEVYFGSMLAEQVISGNTMDFIQDLRNSLLANPAYHDFIRGTFTGNG